MEVSRGNTSLKQALRLERVQCKFVLALLPWAAVWLLPCFSFADVRSMRIHCLPDVARLGLFGVHHRMSLQQLC